MKREIVPLGMRNWRKGREIEVGDEKLSHCEVECIVGGVGSVVVVEM